MADIMTQPILSSVSMDTVVDELEFDIDNLGDVLTNLQSFYPNPGLDFINTFHDCDGLCTIVWGGSVMMLMLHLYIHGEQLNVWADGNLFLLGGTAFFVMVSLMNVFLAQEYPEFLMAPQWMRTVPFALCLGFVTFFYIGWTAELKKAFGDAY